MTIHVTAPGTAPEEKQVGIEIRSSGCPGRRGAWREITGVIPDGFFVSPPVIIAAGKAVNESLILCINAGNHNYQ